MLRGWRIAPVFGGQAGDDLHVVNGFSGQTSTFHEPVGPPLAAVVGNSGKSRIPVSALQLCQILRGSLHRLSRIVTVRQSAQCGCARHELCDPLRARRAQRVGIKPALLPQQPGKEPRVQHMSAAGPFNMLTDIKGHMFGTDTRHGAKHASRT